jgi:dihydrofolate synthase/folylpolyglutamate synthase
LASIRDWLFGLEAAGITLGLDQIRALLAEMGHPERAFTTVTVAGTNGKGSVTAMVERGLRAAGCRTGRYTSPHLIAIEERAALGGQAIDAAGFDAATREVHTAAQRLTTRTSFFEATTAIALAAFRNANVDVAVLEVGLGGRLDATNAVDASLVAITNIGLDHEAYLGNTIASIAAEKAGVIKPGAAVIAGRTSGEAINVLKAKAAQEGAAFTYAPDGTTVAASVAPRESRLTLQTPVREYRDLLLALPGRHQIDNAVTAVRTLEIAAERGIAAINEAAIRTSLSDVRWPGRLDWRAWQGRDLLIDGAHNPDGARVLATFVQETLGVRVPIVVGIMRDKSIAGMLKVLAPVAVFVCTAPSTTRAATPAELAQVAAEAAPEVPCVVAATPREAIEHAASHGTPVIVAGSLFLAGDVLALVA